MAKFNEFFKSPVGFSNCTTVLSGNYSREEAAEIFSEYFDEEVTPDMLDEDRVRYGFPPEHIEDREELAEGCWYTGAGNGKGTKPVWVVFM